MNNARWGICLMVAGIVALGCGGGCGSENTANVSTSRTVATVHGKVTVAGKPVSGGRVEFNPYNMYREDAPVGRAEIAKDGTYTVKTLVGGNVVTVSGPEVEKNASIAFADRVTKLEVNEGDNNHDIDITPTAAKMKQQQHHQQRRGRRDL